MKQRGNLTFSLIRIFRFPIVRSEVRVSPVLISSHKISKKPYVQSLIKKLGVNQKSNLFQIRAIQFLVSIPMSLSACSGCAAKYRNAYAILAYPDIRNRFITALRNAHITCGMFPHRTCDASSPNSISRVQCDGST